ncbi:MAG: porin family protein [Candidatus Stygibacter frigidus]|nr:porin family protein [Candidatus Stygibacter frigidus]
MNNKSLGIFLILIFSLNLFGQAFKGLIRLPGEYDIHNFYGERLSLGERLMDQPGDKKFRRKKALYKWLVNYFFSDDLISYGIKLGWSGLNEFARQTVVFYSDIKGEPTEEELNNTLGSLLGLTSSWFLFLHISNRLGFQPEFNYNINSNSETVIFDPLFDDAIARKSKDLNMSYRLSYLDIPMLFKYKIKRTNHLQNHFSLGFGVNIYLNGISKFSYQEDADYFECPKVTTKIIDLDKLNHFSYYLISEARIEGKSFLFNLRYEYGISRLNSPHFIEEFYIYSHYLENFVGKSWDYKQHNLTITLGYKFSGSKH